MLRSLTLEAFHSLRVCILLAEPEERLLYGSLWPKRLGCGSGPWGPEGRSTGPTLPHLPPHLGVLHQAGHGLLLSISTGVVQPEGAEGRTSLLARPPPAPIRLCQEGAKSTGLVPLSREAHFRETEDRQAAGWAQGTHKVWGFRKWYRANSCMV